MSDNDFLNAVKSGQKIATLVWDGKLLSHQPIYSATNGVIYDLKII